MGEFFPIHWLLVILVILLLFGGRKIPEMMKGLGEGIRSFKEGMKGDGATPVASAPAAPVAPAPPVAPVVTNPPTQEKPQ
jgi:sec-independent protein translocase protein TatA